MATDVNRAARELNPRYRDVSERDVLDLLANEDLSGMGEWRSIERRLLLDAALELMEVVEALPVPVREAVLAVVVTGRSVRAAARTLPGRASFSVAADYARGLRMIWESGRGTVERIA